MYFTHSMEVLINFGRKPGKTFCVQKIYRILKCISTQKFIIRNFPFEDIQSSEIGDIPQVTKETCASDTKHICCEVLTEERTCINLYSENIKCMNI